MKNITLALLAGVALMGQEIPRPAPPFSLALPDGRSVSPSDYKGKVVLLAGLLTT